MHGESSYTYYIIVLTKSVRACGWGIKRDYKCKKTIIII